MSKLVFPFALLFVLSMQSAAAADTIVAAVGEELGGYLAPALAGSGWEVVVCDAPETNNASLVFDVARGAAAFGALWIEEVDGHFRVRLHILEEDDDRYAQLPSGPRDVSGITFASVASSLLDEATYRSERVVVRVDVRTEVSPHGTLTAVEVRNQYSASAHAELRSHNANPSDDDVLAFDDEAPNGSPAHVELSAAIDGWILANVHLGTARWHFIGSLGLLPARTHSFSLGGGFGGQLTLGPDTFLNVDALFSFVRSEQFSAEREVFANGRPEFVGQLRATLGYRIGRRFALVGGVGLATSAAYRSPSSPDSRASWSFQYYEEETFGPASDTPRWRAALWPTVFVGVQIL